MRFSNTLHPLALCAVINGSACAVTGKHPTRSANTIDWASLRCGSEGDANLPTPTYGTEKAVFQVCSQVVINASSTTIYNALLDFQSYHRWNSFVVAVALPSDVVTTPDDLYIGAATTFTTQGVLPGMNTTSIQTVTAMEPKLPGGGRRHVVAWRSDDGAGGVLHRSEHPTILSDLGNGTTLSVSYEPYYTGLDTGAIAALKPTLQMLFEQQNLDLKAYVEGLR